MSDQSRKRKAREQLSPYSQEPINDLDDALQEDDGHEDVSKAFKKARAKKVSTLDGKPALKGLFSNVSLAQEEPAKDSKLKNDMIAGLNVSLLDAINLVLKKQSNKDLRFLFEQYVKYMKDIEKNRN